MKNPPPVDLQQLRLWFQDSPEGRVEGIVWHCSEGTLLKVRPVCTGAAAAAAEVLLLLQVHRHHLGLSWPDGDPLLGARPLVVRLDATLDEHGSSEDLFACFSRLNGHRFSRLRDVRFDP